MKSLLLSLVVLCAVANVAFPQERLKYHRIKTTIDPYQLEKLFNEGLEIDHFSFDKKLSLEKSQTPT